MGQCIKRFVTLYPGTHVDLVSIQQVVFQPLQFTIHRCLILPLGYRRDFPIAAVLFFGWKGFSSLTYSPTLNRRVAKAACYVITRECKTVFRTHQETSSQCSGKPAKRRRRLPCRLGLPLSDLFMHSSSRRPNALTAMSGLTNMFGILNIFPLFILFCKWRCLSQCATTASHFNTNLRQIQPAIQ